MGSRKRIDFEGLAESAWSYAIRLPNAFALLPSSRREKSMPNSKQTREKGGRWLRVPEAPTQPKEDDENGSEAEIPAYLTNVVHDRYTAAPKPKPKPKLKEVRQRRFF